MKIAVSVLVALAAIVVFLPLGSLMVLSFGYPDQVWEHLVDTLLGLYLQQSLLLALGVAVGVLTIGVPVAAIVGLCDFPGRSVLSLLLLLPMAAPAYILAYTYTALLDVAGPLAGLVSSKTLDSVRSLPGAVVILSLVLYPYVYLLSRAAFLSTSGSTHEVGQTLGLTPLQCFWRIALPMARPAIAAGTALAIMETLADYGTVAFFGVPTFTTGIMRTYYGFGDTHAAAQLALTLLAVVVVLLQVERYQRRHIFYYGTRDDHREHTLVRLQGGWAILAVMACLLPVLLGFIIPVSALVYWCFGDAMGQWVDLLPLAINSFRVAFVAAVVVLAFTVFLAYLNRIQPWFFVRLVHQAAGFGYALPGTVIAIGLLVPLTGLDHRLFYLSEMLSLNSPGLLVTGSIFALILAYTVRFTAVSLGAVGAGLERIKPSLDQAGFLAGLSHFQIIRRIHLPMLSGSLVAAMLMVFVDVLKELPATLVLRPFDFTTLAVRAYALAGDERLIDAAPASLTIVLVGLLPVIILNSTVMKRGAGWSV